MLLHWPELTVAHVATWAIAAASTAAVILSPRQLPEAVWAVGGALLLVVTGLITPTVAAHAVWRGLDVYLFLAGMMLLAELARSEGLFDWLAAHAVNFAHGSARRLFALVYVIGVVVTVFMSNDATAVVLTPAVYAATRHAGARPMPHLFACALVANAASFVLPISNPANLVVFGERMPSLAAWAALFLLPSAAAIAGTFAMAMLVFRKELAEPIGHEVEVPALSASGRVAGVAVVAVGLALLWASAAHLPLGLPTLATASLAVAVVLVIERAAPWPLLRHVSWSALALVAGLFVLVAGLEETGLLATLTQALREAAQAAPRAAAWGASVMVALACNGMNNLPAGLIAGSVVGASGAPDLVHAAVAIAVDLGPNLSVTGSLATILWLAAIRREGKHVSAWRFLRVGAVAMPVALVLALACLPG